MLQREACLSSKSRIFYAMQPLRLWAPLGCGEIGCRCLQSKKARSKLNRLLSVREQNVTGRRSVYARDVPLRLVVVTVALMITVQTSATCAADDVQQIKLGTHTFYVPKAWMTGASVTAFLRPQGMVQKPQRTVIETDSVSFRPTDNWRPYNNQELPDYARLRQPRRYASASTRGNEQSERGGRPPTAKMDDGRGSCNARSGWLCARRGVWSVFISALSERSRRATHSPV
jgi:hypothetical protein